MLPKETKFRISLRAARVSSGYTAQEAAKSANISVKQLYKFEHNAEDMTTTIAYKLLRLYRIPFDRIHFGRPEQQRGRNISIV